MNKGLAVIYDPHNLYQFVWYYCSKDNDINKQWDALCLPNGYKGEYMSSICEKTGIFSKIYHDDTDFSKLPLKKKFVMFLSMTAYFLIGKRSAYCKKLLGRYIRLSDYDEINVLADVGIVSGACVALGQEKKVIIMEDGAGDYRMRPKMVPKSHWRSGYTWQGFLMALMGYCSPGWFWLETDKYCIKYASQAERMNYRNYKEIRQLYDRQNINSGLFDKFIAMMYPEIKQINFEKVNTVLFTTPMEDLGIKGDKYKKKLEDYISKQGGVLLHKRHPREEGNYNFEKSITTIEVDNSIPAEVLLPYLKGKTITIVLTSSIILYLKALGLRAKVIVYSGLYEESVQIDSDWKPLTIKESQEYCEHYAEGCYQLVIL